MNYKFGFYITLVLLIISLLFLYTIKVRIDEFKTNLKETIQDVEKFFYEMNAYLRELILTGNKDNIREQFVYSVDKLVDYLKQNIKSIDSDKIKSIKDILEEDVKIISMKIAKALNVDEEIVSEYVNSIKNQIENSRTGQKIASSINYEDSNNAIRNIISNLRNRLNEKK